MIAMLLLSVSDKANFFARDFCKNSNLDVP